MGASIGGIIGGVGSLLGGSAAQSQDLTGYNYLAGNQAISQAQTAGTAGSQATQGTQGAEAQLLGTQPVQQGTTNAFNNYLNSTGYQFQLGQGTSAITGSAAARGILNSGSTAKALTNYGQNLASTTFNNYLGQLGGLNSQQQGSANLGVNAAEATGAAGTTGGGNAGAAQQSAISSAGGQLGSTVANNSAGLLNFFGGI